MGGVRARGQLWASLAAAGGKQAAGWLLAAATGYRERVCYISSLLHFSRMGMVGWVRLLPPLLCHMAPPTPQALQAKWETPPPTP